MVDNTLGVILAELYGVHDYESASELIHAIDLRKKFDLLMRLNKRGRVPKKLEFLVGELRYANENYRPSRNLVAHGMWGTDADEPDKGTFVSFARGQSLESNVLDIAVAQTEFTYTVMVHLLYGITGLVPKGEIPPRPPELPMQSLR